MTDTTTPAFEDIRQATADILDAAIAANRAAKAARGHAEQLQTRRTTFEDVWRLQMCNALTEEGPTPKAKRILHTVIENLAAAEGLNQNTTENAQQAIKAVSKSETKTRIEEATNDVAVIALKERTAA